MKTFILFALLFFAANPAPKPDGKGHQSDARSDLKTESPIVIVNNCYPDKEADHAKAEAPKWDASVWANLAN
jgi:hypothetical protein